MRGQVCSSFGRRARCTVCIALVAAALVFALGGAALAHGERAQEPVTKTALIAWENVRFSTTELVQGQDRLVVTGRFRVLETWPRERPQPDKAYVSLLAPGPKLVLKERWVNGVSAPHSIYIKKGRVYEFRLVAVGRTPGTWHVHPVVAAQGFGSIVGPGVDVVIRPNPAGFQNPVKLADGTVVDAESYAWPWVLGVQIIGLLLGMAWMVYWVGAHRTITRLPLTVQLPLNDDGAAIGLTTRRDHRMVNLIAAVTVLFIVLTYGYSTYTWPQQLPPQVQRLEPPAVVEDPAFVDVLQARATYDADRHRLEIELRVHNRADVPVQLERYSLGWMTWVNSRLAGQVDGGVEVQGEAAVEPATVGAGEEATLRLVITDQRLESEEMLAIGKPMQEIFGMVKFRSADGRESRAAINGPLTPTEVGRYVY